MEKPITTLEEMWQEYYKMWQIASYHRNKLKDVANALESYLLMNERVLLKRNNYGPYSYLDAHKKLHEWYDESRKLGLWLPLFARDLDGTPHQD